MMIFLLCLLIVFLSICFIHDLIGIIDYFNNRY